MKLKKSFWESKKRCLVESMIRNVKLKKSFLIDQNLKQNVLESTIKKVKKKNPFKTKKKKFLDWDQRDLGGTYPKKGGGIFERLDYASLLIVGTTILKRKGSVISVSVFICTSFQFTHRSSSEMRMTSRLTGDYWRILAILIIWCQRTFVF